MTVRPQSILLDAEAFSALARGERRMQAWAEATRRTDSILYASTATLAGVTDGAPADARVRQTAKAVRLVDVNDSIGYQAGALRTQATKGRRKARDLTVDALVAVTAPASPHRPSSSPPTRVTCDCSSPHGEALGQADGLAIELGGGPGPVSVFGPGSVLPDYTLKAPAGLRVASGSTTVEDATQLGSLLRPGMGTCHWAACTLVRNR